MNWRGDSTLNSTLASFHFRDPSAFVIFCSCRNFRLEMHAEVRVICKLSPSILINPKRNHMQDIKFCRLEESSTASFISYDPVCAVHNAHFFCSGSFEELSNDRLCLIGTYRFPCYLRTRTSVMASPFQQAISSCVYCHSRATAHDLNIFEMLYD